MSQIKHCFLVLIVALLFTEGFLKYITKLTEEIDTYGNTDTNVFNLDLQTHFEGTFSKFTKNYSHNESYEAKQLTFEELAQLAGLKAVKYEVITDDGYILGVFRIKGNPEKPVLLMHGLLDSSETFVLRRNNSLARLLADAGYDVWLGNVRGNRYSNKHVTIDPKRSPKEFYDFSFHEFGVYDLPATIDFILNETKEDSLYAVGFSQGNQIFYIMGSEKEEYNKKVKILVALAPISFMQNLPKSSCRHTIELSTAIAPVMDFFGIVNIFEDDDSLRKTIQNTCLLKEVGYDTCFNGILFPSSGYDPDDIDIEFAQEIVPQYPCSASVKNLLHLAQLFLRKKNAQFDYGVIGNLAHYGSAEPPEYNLGKVTMNIEIMQGLNDYLSTVADTKMLLRKLPNAKYHEVQRKECSHCSFVWGKTAYKYVNQPTLEILGRY